MPGISVIIPTYNSAAFIKSCLDSILRQRPEDIEIIVIDNGSRDNIVSFLRQKYPQIRIIENKINLGASQARNQGLALAGKEWVLALDCDVVLDENFFKKAFAIIPGLSERVGTLQPRILDRQGKKVYSAGIGASFLKRFHDIGKGSLDTKRVRRPAYIFGACCATALYRRKMLEEIKDRYGYFDERFFFLFEDADLSWRARKKGWLCLSCPDLKSFHQGNSSATAGNTRQYLSFMNRLRMLLKNQNPLVILFMLPFYLVYDLPRFLILAVKFKGKFPDYKFHGR